MPYCSFMGQGKKLIALFAVMSLLILTTGCGEMLDYLIPWHSSGGDDSSTTTPAIEATKTYAIAIGGVDEGRNELVLFDSSNNIIDLSGKTLEFKTDDDILEFSPRPDYSDFSSGSGALLVPKKVGVAIVKYYIDGEEQSDTFKVIIPPQSLIKILLGEAREQLYNEASYSDDHVELTSTSTTGNAIASVIRNRVLLIESGQPYSLFVVDQDRWDLNPPESHWDAVIEAFSSGVYQFTPVDPNSTSNSVYVAASARTNLTDENLVAYDQAVLTAASIYSNDTADPTGLSFAFRSPDMVESACLNNALKSAYTILPPACGPGDENFPAFEPIQILIHPSVALTSNGDPSFVFYRQRELDEPVVTNSP